MEIYISFIGMLSFFVFISCMITCIVVTLKNRIQKTGKKKSKFNRLLLITGISFLITVVMANLTDKAPVGEENAKKEESDTNKSNEKNDDTSFEQLYGIDKNLLREKLNKVGVEDIGEISPPYITDNGDIDITIGVDDFDFDYSLLVRIAKNNDNYILEEIRGKHSHTLYYVDDSYRYDDEGNEKYDIYDYKTNEKIVKAYNKPLTDEERQRLEQENSEREQEQINTSKTILDEIGKAYDSNSLSATEKYQDKQFLITATVDSVDTTMTGKPRITVYQNDFKVQCVFNEGMLDKVKEVSKGDTITFYGTLDGWGVSADFTHCYFK